MPDVKKVRSPEGARANWGPGEDKRWPNSSSWYRPRSREPLVRDPITIEAAKLHRRPRPFPLELLAAFPGSERFYPSSRRRFSPSSFLMSVMSCVTSITPRYSPSGFHIGK